MKISYIILHYLIVEDTISCVNSILTISKDSSYETNIVIVDNNSPDGSGHILEQQFKGNSNIFVLRNNKNLGFAKGNNVGFLFAKFELKTDFIVMINNDTLVEQLDFNSVLVNKFNEANYYVLGPDIVTLDGYHQNPEMKQSWSFSELRKMRFRLRIEKFFYLIGLGNFYSHLYSFYRSKKSSVYALQRENYIKEDVKNTIINGACLIFSPLYVQRFNGLYDKTFLYMEEDILKLIADYYNFLIMYSGDLKITHKESVSTKFKNKTKRKQVINRNKNMIHSSKVYSRLKRKCKNNQLDF